MWGVEKKGRKKSLSLVLKVSPDSPLSSSAVTWLKGSFIMGKPSILLSLQFTRSCWLCATLYHDHGHGFGKVRSLPLPSPNTLQPVPEEVQVSSVTSMCVPECGKPSPSLFLTATKQSLGCTKTVLGPSHKAGMLPHTCLCTTILLWAFITSNNERH